MSARGRDGGGEAPEPMAGEDLVSLLYGELEPDEAARTSARVATDPTLSARFGEMRRVRELFSAMAEDEPPPRLTAQLLAEAARSAPQPKRAAAPAEAGLWARFISWLQPLAQRPALAAAASLVLVAGVAGVLYMKKGDELTSTTSVTTPSSEPPPVESSMDTTTGSAASDPGSPAPVTGAQLGQDNEGAAAGADGDAEEKADEAAKHEPASPPAKPVAKRKRASGSTSGGDKNMAYDKAPARSSVKSGTVYGLSEQEMVPREQAQAGSESVAPSGGASMNKKSDDAPAAQAAPEPAPPVTPPAADSKAPGKVNVRDLHKRAIDAAMDRRCAEVKMLAGQVRANDSDYYAKSFASDKRLQSCLASPSKSPARK